MILQKNGTAVWFVALSLIKNLPDESDPERPMEERLVQDVDFVSYIGACLCNYILTGCPTDLPYH